MADDNTENPIVELAQGPSKFDAFLEENHKKLIILAVLVTVGVVVTLVVRGMREISIQNAGSKLATASSEEEFNEAMQGAPGNVKATAMLLLADAQAASDTELAISTLNNLISEFPNSEVVQDAMLRVAKLKLRMGDLVGAKGELEKIQSNPGSSYTKPLAQFILADIALSDGKLEESAKLYAMAEESARFAGLRNLSSQGAKFAPVKPPEVVLKVVEPEPEEDSSKLDPDQQDKKSAEEPAKPAEEPAKPAEEPAKPAEESAKPAEEPAKPAEEPAKPAEESAKPAEEPAKPAEESAKPAEESAKPAEEPAKPAEESAKPAEESAKPAGRD